MESSDAGAESNLLQPLVAGVVVRDGRALQDSLGSFLFLWAGC